MPKTVRGRKLAQQRLNQGAVLGFLRLLWRLDHALRSKSKRMARTRGITGLQRFVLRALVVRPRLSAGAMARLLHVHPSTLTGVLRRLEARGLLRRESDASDLRRAVLEVTATGRRLTAETSGTVEDVVREVLAIAPSAQARNTRALLGAMAEAFDP